jgi:hypothetical protein
MMAIVRIKTTNNNDLCWNHIKENHTELEKRFDNCVEIMYMSRRVKYNDISLFIQAGTPDCFGDFISKIIAKIPGVDEVWMFNMLNMKFFYIPEILLDEWNRFVVTIRTEPNKFEETYYKLSTIYPTTEAAPVYIAYTFHLFGDSIMFSFVAKDETAANKFVEENIKNIPDVFVTLQAGIQDQVRLTSPESWKLHVKTNLLTKETLTPPKMSYEPDNAKVGKEITNV